MKIFSQIKTALSASENLTESHVELSERVIQAENKIEDLKSLMLEQKTMIAYLSNIQVELANECLFVSNALRQLTTPKTRGIPLLPLLTDDDDDLIN
jgi:hypothetical protein|tara:strand:+ start:868 stop:1158 length:291 start_codon:yes stop_codon:yes gene_type:complete